MPHSTGRKHVVTNNSMKYLYCVGMLERLRCNRILEPVGGKFKIISP